MTWFENLLYWFHFGPFRRVFRFLARRKLTGGHRILLGPARGCVFEGVDLAYRLGIYEIHVQRGLVRILNSGSVLYDVGANVGFFTLLGAKLVGNAGAVIAFEPSRDNRRALTALCNSNGVRNVELVSEAVSAADGDAYFAVDSSHAQGHLAGGQEAGGKKVFTVTLDSFANTHQAPQVVLMDIEGAEYDALRGARKLLSQERAPAWIIEVHSSENDKLVRGIMEGAGYALTTLVPPVPRVGRYPIHLLAQKPPPRA
jgi:FkbM family methyltransferase